MAEEPVILPAATTAECFPPNSVRDLGSPGAVPLFYPASVSDAGLVGLGYGNGASGAAAWCVRPIGYPTVNPAVGFNYSSNFGSRIAGGNAADLSSGVVATGPGYALNLGNWAGANGLDRASNDAANGLAYGAFQGSRVIGNASDQAGCISSTGIEYSPTASQRADQASDEGGDDSVSGRKVKFLCSYGGKILPRPSDGRLRYVGGQTRIISVKRDVSFNKLVQKMVDTYGQPVVIKYQLPDEDLDALVSVSCPDDIENMMDEYEKLIERSPDGSAKLRVFLFSASEVDLSGVVHFGDLQDSGQKYVEAVNGIADGFSGGITRKESVTSAASTQNSDLSGLDILDSSIAGQGDASGAPMSCVLSPKGNVAASHETTANLVVSEPSAAVHSDASAASLGMPVANSGPTVSPYFQNEVEIENSVSVTLYQQLFGLQQSGKEIPPPASFWQPFVDPCQEVMNRANYVQLPPQMGGPNPQLLGKPGPVITQQQFHDSTASLVSHQVIPALQMTMTRPSSSHVAVSPNAIQSQPVMQLQQNHLDQYHDGNTSGLRITQLPAEHSYSSYQVQVNQVPSVIVGGNYGWVQVPQHEHIIFSDGLSPEQQAMIPEKIQRVEDCSMCQKKLPHAHSDPVVPDQRNSGAGPIPDSIPSYHSLPIEDNLKAQAPNRVVVTATLNEGIVEQGTGTRPRVISKMEPPGVSCTDTTEFSRNLEPQPEGGRILIQNPNGSDHPKNPFIQEAIGRTGEKQLPSNGLTGTTPLSYLDDVVRQHMVPVQNWVEQDVLTNRPVNNDVPIVDGTPMQTSECMVQGSLKEYTNELAGVVSKPDAVDNWISQDHLKPIDGKMDALKLCNPEIYVNNDQCMLPFDKPSANDKLDYNVQHAVEKDLLLDNNFGRSKLIVNANQIKVTEILPCSSTEISYGHNSRPVEYNHFAQPPVWGIPESNPQSKSGNHHKDDAGSSSISPSISPSVRFGDVQDSSNSLFSNQDPWNIQHGTYFPPARANEIALNKETYSYKNQFGENPSNFGEQNLEALLDDGLYQPFKQNLTLEHGWSAKGL